MNAQSYLKSNWYGQKNVGKLKRRLEAVKSSWSPPLAFDLSHNESVRLATDALLNSGPGAYDEMLSWEGELSFLSPSEIQYIIRNAEGPSQLQEPHSEEGEINSQAVEVPSNTGDTYFPMETDSHGPVLEQGWPMSNKKYYLKGPSNISVYFQTEKSHSIKDVLRFYINQAAELIAIVMDVFTDIDIFCDVLEAANKRNVTVYLLLDQCSLQYFTEMCDKLQLTSNHLKNIGVRQVSGDLYCAKSGKKFSGQVQENFIIIDCLYALAGSYSFTWLSAQVHKNFITLYSGHVVECFDEEFRRLYSQSQQVKEFSSVEAVPCSRVSSQPRPFTTPTAVWPKSRNTHSDSFSSLSNLSDPHNLPHSPPLVSEQRRHSGAAPQYRVVYTPLVQHRKQPFLLTPADRPCPAPATCLVGEILKPVPCSKDINVVRTERGEPQSSFQLLSLGQLYSPPDTKHWFSPEQTHRGKYTTDLLFRPNNLMVPKLFNNRY
ncbi:protein FAM83A-like [Pristis pectinata]|uniref:protein FAM83A-like n=1 Tax=Pristis pectinata TaxID=685728 RepID=UPI00223E82BC|nr:protein FAM83A-like [Pristis pectinata]